MLRSLDLKRYQVVMEGCRIITRGHRAGMLVCWSAHRDRPQTIELWCAMLQGPRKTEAAWHAASGLMRARTLTLASVKLLRDLDLLKHLPGIRSLTLRDCPRLTNTDQLAQLAHLSTLSIEDCPAITTLPVPPACALLRLSGLPDLAALEIPEHLSQLIARDCPRLDRLDLTTPIQQVQLRALSPSITLSWRQPTRLTHLSIEQCGAPRLPTAASLPVLETLRLVGDWRTLTLPTSPSETDIQGCTRLTELTFSGAAHAVATGTLTVSECPRLERVALPPSRSLVRLSGALALKQVLLPHAPAPETLEICSCGCPVLPRPGELLGVETLRLAGAWAALDVGGPDVTTMALSTPALTDLRCTTEQPDAALTIDQSPRLQRLTWTGPLPGELNLSGASSLSMGLDEQLRRALYTGQLKATWPPLPARPVRLDVLTEQRALPAYPATPGRIQVAIPPKTRPFYWERWHERYIIVDGPADVAYQTQELVASGYHEAVGEEQGLLYRVKPAPFLPPGWLVYEGDPEAVEHYLRSGELLPSPAN